MIDFIANIIIYLIVQAALLAVAVGVAFVLHGCVPGLDIGMALLVCHGARKTGHVRAR